MKRLQRMTIIVFAAVFCVFIWFYADEKNHADATYPAIYVEDSILEVSIEDGEERLLEGVTAYDEKDGDITNKVLIESVSQFVDDKTCEVTYTVADADRHVARSTRKIRYTDYTSPRFTVSSPLVFSVGTTLKIGSLIGTVDCIDGDISDKVLIAATNYQANSVGAFELCLQVGNSKGDVSYLELPVYVEERSQRAPVIELSDALIYVSKGETPDFASYIVSVSSAYSTLDEGGVVVSADYHPDTEGVYSIHYYAWDVLGNEGHTVLTVVVEE